MDNCKSTAGGPTPGMTRLFLGLVFGLCAYEVYALADKKDGDTISEIVWNTTSHYSILPFAAGVLCGHFFWQRNASAATPRASAPLQ
jgi:hypothetical protein